MIRKAMLAVSLACLLLGAATAQSNWAQFRGPGSLGVAEDPGLPDRWSATENVAWKIDFKTGEIRWEQEVKKGPPESARHLKNSYASETPATDGERVYAYFGNVGLFCFDMKGKLLWSKKWGPFATRYGWGTAASPVPHQDRLYVVNDNDTESFMVALNKRTGEQIWRVARSRAQTGQRLMCGRTARGPRSSQRFGTPEEVAALAVLLASDEAACRTGGELNIDGGLPAVTTAIPKV